MEAAQASSDEPSGLYAEKEEFRIRVQQVFEALRDHSLFQTLIDYLDEGGEVRSCQPVLAHVHCNSICRLSMQAAVL